MASRVQRDGHTVVCDFLAVRHALQGDAGPQPGAQYALCRGCCQVLAVAHAGMVSVGMGDHGMADGPPGVDVKITRRAVQALGPLNNQILHGPEVKLFLNTAGR